VIVYKIIDAQSNEDMLIVSYYFSNFNRLTYMADIQSMDNDLHQLPQLNYRLTWQKLYSLEPVRKIGYELWVN
jgi:hypothetical protein